MGTLHNPSTADVLDRLEAEAPRVARRMAEASRREVGEYASMRDRGFADEVLAHALEHVLAFVRAARTGRPPGGGELDFVASRGAQRARELIPLGAMLEVYLVGQRTVWEAVGEIAGDSPEGLRAARELTALTFGYTHAINVALSQAYLRESEAHATHAERARRELLERLLSGSEPGPAEARRAEALGLRPDGRHVVVAAAVPAGADESQRALVELLARLERPRAFVVGRGDEVVAILPVHVRRGPRELGAELSRAAQAPARGQRILLLAGVSTVCGDLRELARGYAEAVRALRHARPDAPVAVLEELELFDVLTAGADDLVRRLVPAGTLALLEADERGAGALVATLCAYAECDLNVSRTAQLLIVHPNTVHYRLGRVAALSGRDPRRFADLVALLAGVRLSQRDAQQGPQPWGPAAISRRSSRRSPSG
ncbi:MAG: helix-turn-helix domain-containing protein [Thermoleophilaceae bacterium]|nr:helix-turn-helix domain-containing protein [Thermoleophilaceae bacterium]